MCLITLQTKMNVREQVLVIEMLFPTKCGLQTYLQLITNHLKNHVVRGVAKR